MLKLGYKASAEQFAPGKLLDFACQAEEVGFDFGLRQRSLPALEAHRRPRALLARLAGRAGRPHLAAGHGHQRADADLPLPSVDRGAGLRHAGRDVPGPRDPGRRHRRIAERGAVDRRAVARVQGALRPPARGGDPDPQAVARGARHLRGPVLPDREGHDLRPPGRSQCRSTSPRPARWSRAMPAARATASSAPAARSGSSTPRRCCPRSPRASAPRPSRASSPTTT